MDKPGFKMTIRHPPPPKERCSACYDVYRHLYRVASKANIESLKIAEEYASDPSNHDENCKAFNHDDGEDNTN